MAEPVTFAIVAVWFAQGVVQGAGQRVFKEAMVKWGRPELVRLHNSSIRSIAKVIGLKLREELLRQEFRQSENELESLIENYELFLSANNKEEAEFLLHNAVVESGELTICLMDDIWEYAAFDAFHIAATLRLCALQGMLEHTGDDSWKSQIRKLAKRYVKHSRELSSDWSNYTKKRVKLKTAGSGSFQGVGGPYTNHFLEVKVDGKRKRRIVYRKYPIPPRLGRGVQESQRIRREEERTKTKEENEKRKERAYKSMEKVRDEYRKKLLKELKENHLNPAKKLRDAWPKMKL